MVCPIPQGDHKEGAKPLILGDHYKNLVDYYLYHGEFLRHISCKIHPHLLEILLTKIMKEWMLAKVITAVSV